MSYWYPFPIVLMPVIVYPHTMPLNRQERNDLFDKYENALETIAFERGGISMAELGAQQRAMEVLMQVNPMAAIAEMQGAIAYAEAQHGDSAYGQSLKEDGEEMKAEGKGEGKNGEKSK